MPCDISTFSTSGVETGDRQCAFSADVIKQKGTVSSSTCDDFYRPHLLFKVLSAPGAACKQPGRHADCVPGRSARSHMQKHTCGHNASKTRNELQRTALQPPAQSLLGHPTPSAVLQCSCTQLHTRLQANHVHKPWVLQTGTQYAAHEGHVKHATRHSGTCTVHTLCSHVHQDGLGTACRCRNTARGADSSHVQEAAAEQQHTESISAAAA